MALDGGTFIADSTQEVMGDMANTMMLRRAVSRGIAVLDEHNPAWRRRIRWKKLNIGTPKQCLLGQLFESFSEGRRALGLTIEEAIAHGFDTETYQYYPALTGLWCEMH
jgi:hypothetical protein